jgi:peptide methionine sulfoxide reductase MsrB
MVTCNSFSVISHDQYFVFMTTTTEYPVSHKYVVTKGSGTFAAFFNELG